MDNREIYNTIYSSDQLRLPTGTPYDEQMVALRLSLVERYGTGKDVLDLCCGSGSYLIPMIDRLRSAIGVDFSRNMLTAFARRLAEHPAARVMLVEGDASALPLRSSCVDFAFSYTSLYYVPHVELAIGEVARVLRHGGHAALELGNRWSLNTLVARAQHRALGWAKQHLVSYAALVRYLAASGLAIVEWRAFQLLPMYGAPRSLRWLYPILSERWKHLLGTEVGGRMLDEWLSRSWPLRYFCFRHLFVVTRT